MTTDLRAALRNIAEKLTDATLDADPEADEGNHEEANEYLHIAIGHAVKRLRALADAPPTVAELLPMVDATHEVHWTDADGTEWRAVHADSDGGSRIAIEMRCHRGWMIYYPLASDFLLPARLVEVSP